MANQPNNVAKVILVQTEDGDDSMGALFRAYREDKNRRKQQKLDAFQDSPLKGMLNEHTPYHYSTILQGDRLDYWPSGGKWRWRGKTQFGNWLSCYNFIRKRLNKGMENKGRSLDSSQSNDQPTRLPRLTDVATTRQRRRKNKHPSGHSDAVGGE